MAVDEALLDGFSGAPTLRLYRWSRPALSIGYFQSVEDVRRGHPQARGADVVRRITGGGAVRHGEDLTLSIVLPDRNPFFPHRAAESYAGVHGLLLKCFEPDFPGISASGAGPARRPRALSSCFEEPVAHDLSWRGRKAVGSSQRRRRGALLHQCCVALPAAPQRLAALTVAGFEAHLGARFETRPVTAEEAARAQTLMQEKYAHADFSSAAPSLRGATTPTSF